MSTLNRRHFTTSMLFTAMFGTSAFAQTTATDVLSMLVPYAAGGSSDVVARILQPTMAKVLGKTIIVDNVSGVLGSIASQKMLSSASLGQSMLVGSPNELVLAPLSLKVIKYKPQDFKLVAHLATASLVLFVRPEFPATNLEELVKLVKAPGAKPLTYASTGNGSIYHLVAESLASKLGVQMTHVPYRGGAPAIQDLAGNNVDIMFGPVVPQYVQMVEAGRMKAIGIAASARSPVLPKVQTFSELPPLKDFYFDAWIGIFLPANTPTDAAVRIGKAAYEAAATPEFQKLLKLSGNSAGQVLTVEQAAMFYKHETDRYQQIAKAIKLEAE